MKKIIMIVLAFMCIVACNGEDDTNNTTAEINEYDQSISVVYNGNTINACLDRILMEIGEYSTYPVKSTACNVDVNLLLDQDNKEYTYGDLTIGVFYVKDECVIDKATIDIGVNTAYKQVTFYSDSDTVTVPYIDKVSVYFEKLSVDKIRFYYSTDDYAYEVLTEIDLPESDGVENIGVYGEKLDESAFEGSPGPNIPGLHLDYTACD